MEEFLISGNLESLIPVFQGKYLTWNYY